MTFQIDHVTLAAPTLDSLVESFAAAGMTPDYGGAHWNRITHMSLLGFNDGSYIELISTISPGTSAPRWGRHIARDGGPCAWAVEVRDIAAHAARIASAGISVDGPTYVHRERPDGVLVEWDLAFVGEEGPGALHPFLIEDRTPKDFRVGVSESVRDGPSTGVAKVVIAVPDLEMASETFQRVYDLSSPYPATCSLFPSEVYLFPGEPLGLVTSDDEDSWIGRRIQRFGASPCAYLLGCTDLERGRAQYGFEKEDRLGETDLLWLRRTGTTEVPLGICNSGTLANNRPTRDVSPMNRWASASCLKAVT